jgi:DNA-binding NarL/FixJ family response regulator
MKRHGVTCETQIKQAKDRIEQIEARVEKSRTREELAERRAELAETRTELAETRAALAEVRAEQAETTLQRAVHGELEPCNGSVAPLHQEPVANGVGGRATPLEELTTRQREILQHIAEGQNTKQIAETLNLSPKTVEYHRARLMNALGVHDIPGLVRLAVRVGLVPAEG